MGRLVLVTLSGPPIWLSGSVNDTKADFKVKNDNNVRLIPIRCNKGCRCKRDEIDNLRKDGLSNNEEGNVPVSKLAERSSRSLLL